MFLRKMQQLQQKVEIRRNCNRWKPVDIMARKVMLYVDICHFDVKLSKEGITKLSSFDEK